MPRVLLTIPPHRQQGDADCLAACAAMVLAHLGQPVDYDRLLRLLDVQFYGAPAGNIRRLSRLNLTVTYSHTDISGLEALLDQRQKMPRSNVRQAGACSATRGSVALLYSPDAERPTDATPARRLAAFSPRRTASL